MNICTIPANYARCNAVFFPVLPLSFRKVWSYSLCKFPAESLQVVGLCLESYPRSLGIIELLKEALTNEDALKEFAQGIGTKQLRQDWATHFLDLVLTRTVFICLHFVLSLSNLKGDDETRFTRVFAGWMPPPPAYCY